MQNYIRLSRSKLFDAVWKTPLVKLAEQYGISNVTIKKKCVKYEIPTPSRGYWAKKLAGHKVKIPTLAIEDYNPEIKIRLNLTKKVTENNEPKIIPDKLNKPLKVILETKKAYKDTYNLSGNYLQLLWKEGLRLKVSPRSLLWALSVYDAVLKELKKADYKLDSFEGKFEISKRNVNLSIYIYEKSKIVRIDKENKKYELTDLLALKVSGSFGVEGVISESKKHGFKNRLSDIVNHIETVVHKSHAEERNFRLNRLKNYKQKQLKILSETRQSLFSSLKKVEKEKFDSLLSDATMHNNCNIVRQYLEAMECKWRKESSNLSKEQKDELKEARTLINRYDPLIDEYRNLQNLHIDNDMMNRPWREIQKIIDGWLKVS